jgi:hypothetical protein
MPSVKPRIRTTDRHLISRVLQDYLASEDLVKIYNFFAHLRQILSESDRSRFDHSLPDSRRATQGLPIAPHSKNARIVVCGRLSRDGLLVVDWQSGRQRAAEKLWWEMVRNAKR